MQSLQLQNLYISHWLDCIAELRYLAKKFYSKGKGANRKVIPISDKKGGSKSVNVIAIAYPLERMSEPEREFEAFPFE